MLNYWVIPGVDEMQTADGIIDTVCRKFEVSKADVLGKGRDSPLPLARQVIIYFMVKNLKHNNKSFKQEYIADMLNINRSYIPYSVNAVQHLIKIDTKFRNLIEWLQQI